MTQYRTSGTELTPYEMQMQAVEREEQQNRFTKNMERGFQIADMFVNRGYLDYFGRAEIVMSGNEQEVFNPYARQSLRIFRMTKIVYDEQEDILDKLTSVYNALYNISASVAIFIQGNERNVDFYLAVKSEESPELAGRVMQDMLKGNFPGIKLTSLNAEEIESFQTQMQNPEPEVNLLQGLCTVSMIPSLRSEKEKEKFVQGMEKFVNTLQHKNYLAVFLSVPLDHNTIMDRKHGYEQMFSTLSPHGKMTYAYGENSSSAINEGVSRSFSDSVNESVSNTNSTSTTNTETRGSASASGSNSGASVSGASWGSSSSFSRSSSSSYSSGNSFSRSISNSVGHSASDSRNYGKTETTGTSDTRTINFENKAVSNLMKKIEEQINRITQWESYGLWENCAYFFSDDTAVAVEAATSYKAIMTGEKSAVESTHVNTWDSADMYGRNIQKIFEHVKLLSHPKAELQVFEQKQMVSPTSLVSGKELALLMGFPRKAISGVAVQEMAEFGRDVVYERKIPEKTISFGNIYHMGVEEKQTPVLMDLELFSSHCFITGSSGSGKSYATYNLLDCLLENGIKMLAIEPAKGEYKQVFGGLRGINIFTLDMNTYRFLRINPFQFPEQIHVLSHIEQLLQIFNASWPLYAAMPAILKEAVVKAYIKCGWDLQNSIWIKGISEHKYPVFQDVLDVLPDIINTSDYSADSQGDYKGALLTRVQAMTTGINGMIFRKSEGKEDEVLFDQNTVIDLSEAGSEETIALLMGVLIMKLNEHRKAQRKKGIMESHDSRLRHVTVLEEAHNILKRTSKEQNQEGSNMVGKSVEMISNSIKEMRTYGEGFMIIDQSPLAVDSSVVENSATKIIMNTPSSDACKELGSALSLNEKQIRELSRLNVGVAAVMQKGWLTPVLMKVGMWNPDKYERGLQYENRGKVSFVRSQIARALIRQIQEQRYIAKELSDIIRSSELPQDRKDELGEITTLYRQYKAQSAKLKPEMLGRLFMEITGCEALFDIVPSDFMVSPEFLSQWLEDKEEDEVVEIYGNLLKETGMWIQKMRTAMEQYVDLEEDEKDCALQYMLAEKSDNGERADNIFSTICMLYMNFREDLNAIF